MSACRVRRSARRWLWWGLRLGVGLALMAWLLSTCSRESWEQVLQVLHPAPLLAAIAISVFGVSFSAVPWKIMLAPVAIPVTWTQAILLNHLSYAINNLIPGGLGGDALRAWIVGKPVRRYAEPFATVLLDRWLSFLCLFSIAFLTGAWYWTDLCGRGLQSVLLGVFAVFLLLLAVSGLLFVGQWQISQRLLGRFTVGSALVRVSAIMVDFLHRRSIMVQCYLLTLVTPLLDAYIFWLISECLQLHLPFWVYLLMVPVMRVIHHVPVSVNAVGTQDAACVFYLAAFGVGQAESLTVSLAMHAIKLLGACLCGSIYLLGAEKSGITREAWKGAEQWQEELQAETEQKTIDIE